MKLKFRVYDKRREMMVYLNDFHDSFCFYEGEATYYNLENGDGTGDGYSKPMLFTGLYDEEGTEIYQDDIVIYKGHRLMVAFNIGSFMLVRLSRDTEMIMLFEHWWNGEEYPLSSLYLSTYQDDDIICNLKVVSNIYAENRS